MLTGKHSREFMLIMNKGNLKELVANVIVSEQFDIYR